MARYADIFKQNKENNKWELTVPWKESVEDTHERKKFKSDELLETCKNNG